MHLNINNYGVVEDVHHILMHIMLQFLRQKYMSKKNRKIKILKILIIIKLVTYKTCNFSRKKKNKSTRRVIY